MEAIVKYLWLIPVLPLLAAGWGALLPRSRKRLAAALAIGSVALSGLLALWAFCATLNPPLIRHYRNWVWFDFGATSLQLGWVLDPLAAVMLVMVTLVSLLIFIYSLGYMAHDDNAARFFCFMALFAAAMLGIVIANSLLLFFVCWELVGLASYLLIGFWFQKPAAAAAAKKAFITTRIGDLGLLLGMLWLYSQSGTLLFYDNGHGCLEQSSLAPLLARATLGGMAVSTGISLLIFCGAVGKSGQVPLHVWLPDAMEGPTPVSALIHAATMVAAGVFLVARMFPLMSNSLNPATGSSALHVVTWVGAITAVFAASIAVAQNDIKRILAYSTVSQLGYMMMGLGVGGVAVGMFHLITHACFKALLFLGAGSVIHGCSGGQDIRRMGGLRKFMPLTFVTYAVGTMALCGVPLFFSGFWSKEEILHAARHWPVSNIPFCLGVAAAFLTAFYMTRQVAYVFFGKPADAAQAHPSPRESPPVMTVPLAILAVLAILVGFLGTPAWPWFQSYLTGEPARFTLGKIFDRPQLNLMFLSTIVIGAAIALGWRIYARAASQTSRDIDPLEKPMPAIFACLRNKFFVDEFYARTLIRWTSSFSVLADWLDRFVWGGAVWAVARLTLLLSFFNNDADESLVNQSFDNGCEGLRNSGRLLALFQNGQVQRYLRVIGVAFAALVLLLFWGCA
ncbi:MAG: NADH-quinone oxidoreductase subunit L [Verrucomicrobiota bacterium]|jgi:NADH-quinone oxidoreductase subunit L